jgi:uncharacterized protein with von Willebrand factor type A (vWA) domain
MKDKIQKLASLNQEVVDLLKEEKMEDVVEKLAQIQELTKEMDEAVETPADPVDPKGDVEDIEKQEKINKTVELLEKYATLNISADTVKDLIDQFGELKEKLTTSTETINKLNERLEVVEKTKGISKQAGEEINKSSINSVWDDLAIL